MDTCPNCGYCAHCGRSNATNGTTYKPLWWKPDVICGTTLTASDAGLQGTFTPSETKPDAQP